MHVVAFVHRTKSNHREVINCEMLDLRDLLAPEVEPVIGDENGDGRIDISDVNNIINIMLGKAQ